MPPSTSKKAENLKAETKKLEDMAKKKVQAIDKTEKAEEENTKKEIQQISLELEKFKQKTNDVMSGKAEATGWDEQAVRVGERMKQLIEEEARQQHNLLLKTDEATAELELKAKPIRKELPLVSDFSEEDRVQILTGIDKSINKLKEKREMIEMEESKLNRQMQVLMEYTPDPTEDKQAILSKLQMSYDVVSGANDPDRARDELLKQLTPSLRKFSNLTQASSASKKSHLSTNQKPIHTSRPSNPSVPPNLHQERMPGHSNPPSPPSTVQANLTIKPPSQMSSTLSNHSSSSKTPVPATPARSTPAAHAPPTNSNTARPPPTQNNAAPKPQPPNVPKSKP